MDDPSFYPRAHHLLLEASLINICKNRLSSRKGAKKGPFGSTQHLDRHCLQFGSVGSYSFLLHPTQVIGNLTHGVSVFQESVVVTNA